MIRFRWLFLLLAVPVFFAGASVAGDGTCDCEKSGFPDSAAEWATLIGGWAQSPVAWAGVAVSGSGLVWLTWRRVWIPRLMLAVPGYARLSPDEVVNYPARAVTLGQVQTHPACTTKDLAALTELNGGTLRYHLAVLERSKVIVSRRLGRDRVWFSAQSVPGSLEAIVALRVPTRKALLEVISQRPGLTQSQLARAVQRAKATAHHHLAELTGAGLVTRLREGLRVRYYPVPLASMESVAPMRETQTPPTRFFRR